MIEVRTISAEETHPLRHLVLWPHKPSEDACTIDIDEREDAIHLGGFDGFELVAIGSLFEMSHPKLFAKKQYRLRVMATHPDYRGTGAGKALVEYALELLKEKGVELLWCDARKVALGFYQRLGFDVIDEWYDVPEIGPHKLMYKKL